MYDDFHKVTIHNQLLQVSPYRLTGYTEKIRSNQEQSAHIVAKLAPISKH